MSALLFSQIEFLTPEYDLSVRLRDELLRKPLKLEFTKSNLEEEMDEFHFGIFNYFNDLIACLSLKPIQGNGLKMRQVAVKFDLQGKGVGRKLVEYSEKWMIKNNYSIVELNARDTAVPFYTKLHYYKAGEMFIELDIPHWKMTKNLSNEKNT